MEVITFPELSLLLSVTTTESSPSWSYFGTQTRAWELAFGAMLAITVTVWTRMPPALASQMSWVGLGMILLSVFAIGVAGLWRLVNSPYGRVVAAIRQSEVRAAHLGYNVWLYKASIFTLSAAVSGRRAVCCRPEPTGVE